MGKLKIALYWTASCGGCEIAQLQIGDELLKTKGCTKKLVNNLKDKYFDY